MSDARRRYRAIDRAMTQRFPTPPTGRAAQHQATLTALICGLMAQLPQIASHVPTRGVQQESLMMQFRRWLQHPDHTQTQWYLPVAQLLLTALVDHPLVLVIDGSVVGRG